MAVSYKKLWKLLIDMDIKKKDLSSKAGVSPATITKMGKDGAVVSSDVTETLAILSIVPYTVSKSVLVIGTILSLLIIFHIPP